MTAEIWSRDRWSSLHNRDDIFIATSNANRQNFLAVMRLLMKTATVPFSRVADFSSCQLPRFADFKPIRIQPGGATLVECWRGILLYTMTVSLEQLVSVNCELGDSSDADLLHWRIRGHALALRLPQTPPLENRPQPPILSRHE